MPESGRDIRERNEHKCALVRAGMGNAECFRMDDVFVEEQHIDVLGIFPDDEYPNGYRIGFECQITLNEDTIEKKLKIHRRKVDKLIFVIPSNIESNFKGDFEIMKTAIIYKKSKSKNTTITLTMNSKLINWIDGQIQKQRFNNRSHALRYCCAFVMNVHPENVGNGD